jgi:ABC-type sulfate/molybdate transport systems ATPase subunit
LSGPPPLRAAGLAARRGRRAVLEGIDLELRAGEITAVLGPNGAGKSTLLDILAGLLPPSAGRLERRGRVAAALQAPVLARRSAQANVELGLAWWGVPRAERRQRAGEALRALGAAHLGESRADTLSGGEARRVHLARALAVRPDVLLLDEPFAGLDVTARADLLEDVAGVLRSPDRSACIVVHDRSEAWALADQVLLLLDGRLVAAGAPAEVLDRPPSVAAARFLGFSGELDEPGGRLLVRPGQVSLDPRGDRRATVRRRLPVEDGLRLELVLDNGTLFANAPHPAPESGTEVGLRVTGGVRFAPAGDRLG